MSGQTIRPVAPPCGDGGRGNRLFAVPRLLERLLHRDGGADAAPQHTRMERRITMKRTVLMAMIAVGLTFVAAVADAQVKKGKTRPATTKQLMSGVVQPHCAAIGEAVKQAPADDAAWEKVATHAAVLNEISYTLMEDGRCPDADWANASTILRTASDAVLVKALAKDHAGVAAEFAKLTESCGACHKVHKK